MKRKSNSSPGEDRPARRPAAPQDIEHAVGYNLASAAASAASDHYASAHAQVPIDRDGFPVTSQAFVEQCMDEHHETHRRKRRRSLDAALIEEMTYELKRSKISMTPGELRLKKDVVEVLPHLARSNIQIYWNRFKPSSLEFTISLRVASSEQEANKVVAFRAEAPVHYPHSPLNIWLSSLPTNAAPPPSLNIDPRTYQVQCPLQPWNPTYTLWDILQSFAKICNSTYGPHVVASSIDDMEL